MIHVKELLNFNLCHRYCWNMHHERKPFEGYYHMDVPFSDIWIQYLNLETYGKGEVGDSNEDTLNLLQSHDVVLFARFEYKECRTKIPVLMKIDGGYKAIYPHLSPSVKEETACLMKINTMIAKQAGVNIIKNEIIYLNKDYIRQDTLDLNQLLNRSDCLFNKRNKLSKTIAECMDLYDFNLDDWIEQTNQVINQDYIPVERSKKCTIRRRCMFYDQCFDDENQVDDSILYLTTSSNKLDLYKQGLRRICEMDAESLDGFRLQYAQYMASKNNGLFFDKAALNIWTSQIQYPISYLDFEWDTFAIPPYKGMKPFDVLCFQYSLHIEDENHFLKHYDFFKTKDCRKDFIESLLENVPKTGSILVYNMEGAEKLRLKQLGEQFPKYAKDLEQIYSRMIDLSKPFECGLFYDNRMHGHYSLKNVLPVFTDTYSYKQLSIQNGLNAVFTYRTFDEADESDKETIYQELCKYCSMDTFAEYITFHGLRKQIKEE